MEQWLNGVGHFLDRLQEPVNTITRVVGDNSIISDDLSDMYLAIWKNEICLKNAKVGSKFYQIGFKKTTKIDNVLKFYQIGTK